MNKNFCYAEFVIGNIQNRNKIFNINEFKLNGINTDCFRSLFLFDENLLHYVKKTGSVKGFSGLHITDAVPIDFDGSDLNEVKREVIDFINHLYWNYEIPNEYLKISFSGNKGFHIVLPIKLFDENPQPKEDFYLVVKNIVKDLAEGFKFVDFSIYESKRIFRMLNTKNSKSGLYKIPLTFDELDSFSIDKIKELAKTKRTVELFPINEISVNKSLNELYKKWCNYNFNQNPKNENINLKDDLLNILKNGVDESNRHNALIRITGALEKKGLDYDFILQILKDWNLKNRPPLPNDRLENESKRCFDDNRKKQDISLFKIYNLQDAEIEYKNYVKQIDSFKVKIGFDTIDKKIRGIMPGETMCILGKTSVGKSALLQNIGMNFTKESKEPVLFFSLEMPVNSVFERAMQIETGLSGYEVENQYKFNSEDIKLKAKLLFNDLSNFYIITKSGLNLEQIKNLIMFAEDNIYHKKTGLILIDYLGLVRESGKDIYEQVSKVARAIKDIAKEFNVPIIFLSQVNRNYKEYDELTIDSARDSGVIDEASDFIIGIWKEKDDKSEIEQPEIKLKLGILKNRKGGLGRASITMSKKSLRIVESDLNENAETTEQKPINNFNENLEFQI